MKLRQVALVASDLAQPREDIFRLLGISEDFADPGVGEFGLHNSVMAVGDTFLEIVAPTREGTAAGRLLERRRGDCGYMVLVQVEDIEPYRELTEQLGIRKVWNIDRDEAKAFHVHPRDIGAAIVSFDQMIPPESWAWAGPGWRDRKARHVSTISGVDIQGADPESLAQRWSQAFARDFIVTDEGYRIQLDEGTVTIKPATDGRGDGVTAVQFDVADAAQLRAAAKDLGLSFKDDTVQVCGTDFRFRF